MTRASVIPGDSTRKVQLLSLCGKLFVKLTISSKLWFTNIFVEFTFKTIVKWWGIKFILFCQVVRMHAHLLLSGVATDLYKWIACGLCSIIVWFAFNRHHHFTSHALAHGNHFVCFLKQRTRVTSCLFCRNDVHELVKWRNVDAVCMRT